MVPYLFENKSNRLGMKFLSFSPFGQDQQEEQECAPGMQKGRVECLPASLAAVGLARQEPLQVGVQLCLLTKLSPSPLPPDLCSFT